MFDLMDFTRLGKRQLKITLPKGWIFKTVSVAINDSFLNDLFNIVDEPGRSRIFILPDWL
jgi:hypothetical protein